MKRLPLILLCWLALVAFTQYKQIRDTKSVLSLKSLPVKQVEIKSKPVKIQMMDRNAFLNAMGHQESGNRYHIVNRYGYMGKYQFGKSTLKTIKIKVSRTEFLNNPELQEEAMLKLLRYNKKKLQKYIDKFDGQTVNGILITESGLLAAAHLGGAGSVRKWFRTGKVRKDGFGTKITSYMIQFNGYTLDLNGV